MRGRKHVECAEPTRARAAAPRTFGACPGAPLSLCVITATAAQLDDCLASVPFAGEIVVVDSGSRDDTVEIARRRGARVVDHAWPGFGAQKDFAVGEARTTGCSASTPTSA